MTRDRVTWRLEITVGWGGRLDPTWLPSSGTEGWRRVFEGEDLAGRVFAAGGAGLRWAQLAEAAAGLASVLEQYRMQWRCADEVAASCPVDADAHLAAMAVPPDVVPPRRMRPDGRWRVCTLTDGAPATVVELASSDLAEGAVVAHRTLAADRAFWAEPVAAGPAPRAGGAPGWTPRIDTDLRLTAFAAEEAVATLCTAATTGQTGPDVLSSRLLCTLGLAAHRMIMEYRTLFRDAWTPMEACRYAAEHDADAEARLAAAPDPAAEGPGRRWRHAVLMDGTTRTVSEHDGLTPAAAAVAAHRAVDERSERWAEPVHSRACNPSL